MPRAGGLFDQDATTLTRLQLVFQARDTVDEKKQARQNMQTNLKREYG
jgi:hypothetical protein